MRNPDVIVTGVGRSGTSTVSRILVQQLRVCMGHQFHRPAPFQPLGSFEDTRMVGPGQCITGGFPFKKTTKLPAEEWLKAFKQQHRNCTNKVIGVKSPHLSGCTLNDWNVIKPRIIFRTSRPKDLVLASMNKWRNSGLDWSRFIDEREANMDEVFGELDIPVVCIVFDRIRPDESLLGELRRYLRDVGLAEEIRPLYH